MGYNVCAMLVDPCRGVYHGQEGSAELLDDPAAREEAGVTSRGRVRTQVSGFCMPDVSLPLCRASKGCQRMRSCRLGQVAESRGLVMAEAPVSHGWHYCSWFDGVAHVLQGGPVDGQAPRPGAGAALLWPGRPAHPHAPVRPGARPGLHWAFMPALQCLPASHVGLPAAPSHVHAWMGILLLRHTGEPCMPCGLALHGLAAGLFSVLWLCTPFSCCLC